MRCVMRGRKVAAAIALAILASLALWRWRPGLEPSTRPTPAPPPSASTPAAYPTAFEAGRLGFVVALREPSFYARAPQYKLPLSEAEVENWDAVRRYVRGEAARLLLENGFVVVDWRSTDLAEMYKGLADAGLPLYISADSVFFIYHALFQQLLADLEEQVFYGLLLDLVRSLVDAQSQLLSESSGLVKEASLRNLAYLSVAAKLLDPEFKVPDEVRELVEAEVKLITEARSPEARSPIFEYTEDYTQYKPRGHYTTSEKLRRYFKAMMWLGRMRFELEDRRRPELADLQTAQALLLTYLMQRTKLPSGELALDTWLRIYAPTAFIVGYADDLTFLDYAKAMKDVYGEFKPEDVEDRGRLSEVRSKLMEVDRSRIVSSPWYPNERRRMGGLRFMGQRFILDGYIHQMLCYPSVAGRTMVKGLDVMAALGSDRALQHLKEEAEKYPGYSEKLEELRGYVSSMKAENWTQSLYMMWLYTIRAELQPPGEGYPPYMRTEAWLDKSLETALGSWAHLRHDTILYAKQPYAAKVALPAKPPHPGYVEPLPHVYARLRALAEATRDGLSKMGVLPGGAGERLSWLADLLKSLEEISVKELEGKPLSEEELKVIRGFPSAVERLLSAEKPRFKDPRVVADVFTDPNTNRVLEVGTGYFNLIIVVYATPDGKLLASAGAVLSYYEFTWPQENRLTDEQWRQMLDQGKAPPQPEWVESYRP